MLKKLSLFALLCSMCAAIAASDSYCSHPEYWKGYAGEAPAAPEISRIKTEKGDTIRIAAVADGIWQAFDLYFPEAVDISQYDALSFDMKQNVRSGEEWSGMVVLKSAQHRGIQRMVNIGHGQWVHVHIPLDKRTWIPFKKVDPVEFLPTIILNFYPWRALDAPGRELYVANLEFLPKRKGPGPITVTEYSYLTPPTDGDPERTVLTDGNAEDKDAQANYQQYTADPEIVFDLGTIYRVDSIKIDCLAPGDKNICDFTISTSPDNKTFTSIGNYRASEYKSGSVQEQHLAVDGLNCVGRYVKLATARSRTDFSIRIAEVSFSGEIPSDKELAAINQSRYDLGPDIAPVNGSDYVRIHDDDAGSEMYFSRSSGVGCAYSVNGELVAERFFNTYELNDGNKAQPFNAYTDKVSSIDVADDGKSVTISSANPHLPDTVISTTHELVGGRLESRTAFRYTGKEPLMLYGGKQVILARKFREGGLYEAWGGGHHLKYGFAANINFDQPADGAAVMVFEATPHGMTLLHYRHHLDGAFIQINAGKLAANGGIEDKRTLFTANGWHLAETVAALRPETPEHSVATALALTPGTLMEAYDAYLSRPDAKSFRASIHRPEWLRDFRGIVPAGYLAEVGERNTPMLDYYNRLFREGVFGYDSRDADFVWSEYVAKDGMKLYSQWGSYLSREELLAKLRRVKEHCPLVRYWCYTWLWSNTPHGYLCKQYEKHPDWYIDRDANGNKVINFPWGENFYRRYSNPESRQEAFDMIRDFIVDLDQDLWYIDGGHSLMTADFHRKDVDSPLGAESLYYDLRKTIQKSRADRALFSNNPENPVFDLGYFEASGAFLSRDWHNGATLMYKFKLFQRPDELFTPIYINWLPDVQVAFQNYMATCGLHPGCYHCDEVRNALPWFEAQYQIHRNRMVNANMSPNWRTQPGVTLETMALSGKNYAYLSMISHADAPKSEKAALDIAPLALDGQSPLWQWQVTLANPAQYKGWNGEKEAESIYRASRWSNDAIASSRLLAFGTETKRAEAEFQLAPNQPVLWLFTRVPGFVYSENKLRNQLWLPSTDNVVLDGDVTDDKVILTVQSKRAEAEILAAIPPGRRAVKVTVDGKDAALESIVFGGANFTLAAIKGEGKHRIEVALGIVENAAPIVSMTLPAELGPGQNLAVNFNAPLVQAMSIQFESDGALYGAFPVAAGKETFEIKLPEVLRGGDYTVTLMTADGAKAATGKVHFAAGASPYATPRLHVDPTWITHADKIDVTHGAFHFTEAFTEHQEDNTEAEVIPEAAQLHLHHKRIVDTMYLYSGAALKFQARRFVKVRVAGNFDFFNLHCLRGPVQCAEINTDRTVALTMDFGKASGGMSRSLAGLGVLLADRVMPDPRSWGTKAVAEHLYSISDLIRSSTENSEEMWLDLQALGAPDDWNGELIFGLLFDLAFPERDMTVTLLDMADTLPAGAKAVKAVNLRPGDKSVQAETITVPVVKGKIAFDGNTQDEAWQDAVKFPAQMLLAGSAEKPFPQKVEARLLHDGKTLFLAIDAFENEHKGTLVATSSEDRPFANESVECFLGSADGLSQVQVVCDCSGHFICRGYSRPAIDKPWADNVNFKAPVEMTAKAFSENGVYHVEIAIPASALDLQAFDDKAEYGVNICRNRYVAGGAAGSMAPGSYNNIDAFHLVMNMNP